ncbi:MAG: hypothetical protein ACKOWF_03090 [Chloroflexota bacterium]
MERVARKQLGDTALAIVARERLPSVLAVVHGRGFGPMARVFDPGRGALAGQLQRAGLPVPPDVDRDAADRVVLGITAPGHAARIGDTLLQAGAAAVFVACKGREGVPPAVIEAEGAAAAPGA